MPCYKPLTGWRSRFVNESGKRSIVFNPDQGFKDMEVTVPCGRCRGCRLDYSRQWALRCIHEAQLYDDNCFITLTFNSENIPEDQSIRKEHLQKFFKRLRKRGFKFRYFACGEYGEENLRPHYHACIFGFNFPDKVIHTKRNGHVLYRSQILEEAWQYGYSLIGELTFDSAAYVARYVMKKRKGDPDQVDPITGKTNQEYYLRANEETGEMYEVEPEFCLMSRRPGLGRDWYEKFKQDTKKDFITVAGGKKVGLPKYYDSILEAENEIEYLARKKKRRYALRLRSEDNTPDRLDQRERVKEAQTKYLIRDL